MPIHTYAGFAAIAVVIFLSASGITKRRRLPPGPKPLPIIGNLLDYPKEKPWLTFTDWKKRYGDIIYLNIFGKRIVVLNSFKACKELLEKHSAKSSDRPKLVMLTELVGFDFSFALMGYSHRWRHHRRLFHLHFHENKSMEYRQIQEHTVHTLLRRLLETPSQLQDHIRMLFAESILEVVYAITPKGPNDIFVQSAEEAVYSFTQSALPGRWLVDTFPILKYVPSWMPGAGFQTQAKKWRNAIMTGVNLPAAYVKKGLENGTAQPSMFASILTGYEDKQDAREMIGAHFDETLENAAKGACASAYFAGSDTTLSAIQMLFLVMANNPNYQKLAQEELDAVIGQSRLPSFEDMVDLPYIAAITKEMLRWHVIVPLSLPHAFTEDDEYEGYFIPKGTVIFPNTWSLLRDPEVYPDPHTFKPERWLHETPEGRTLNKDVPEPDAAFGYGRRICPGRHFANASLFITVASVLACYNILPLDAFGRPAEKAREELSDGLLTYPLPYNISIVPRSEKAIELIKDTATFHSA